MRKKVLVTNAGRSAGLNFCRSLRLAKDEYEIIGIDQNKYSLMNAEVDQRYLCPDASDAEYINYLKKIVDREKVDVVYPSKSNEELWLISKNRDDINAHIFLPEEELVQIFEDKFLTNSILEKEGIRVPKTYLITEVKDLEKVFQEFPEGIWLRAIRGCGGKGSIIAKNIEFASAWITHNNGWGNFTASEILTDKTATWSAVWNEGELVVSQVRRRLYWEFSYLSPSGVTGITGAQITDRDTVLDEIALKSIYAITKKPHGIISVDFTYDKNGIPNPTEIQASRYFSSTYFMAKAGLNFPEILVKLALGEKVEDYENKYSPLEPNLLWIKYVDCPAKLTTVEAIEKIQKYI